jgi:hypothetical protein
MPVWILTEEYNEHDQHGEYFVAIFKNKPTVEQLNFYEIYETGDTDRLLKEGHTENDYHRYNLREFII